MSYLILAAIILLIVVVIFVMTSSHKRKSTFTAAEFKAAANNVEIPTVQQLVMGILDSWRKTGNYNNYTSAEAYMWNMGPQFNPAHPSQSAAFMVVMEQNRNELHQRLNQAMALALPVINNEKKFKSQIENSSKHVIAVQKAMGKTISQYF